MRLGKAWMQNFNTAFSECYEIAVYYSSRLTVTYPAMWHKPHTTIQTPCTGATVYQNAASDMKTPFIIGINAYKKQQQQQTFIYVHPDPWLTELNSHWNDYVGRIKTNKATHLEV